jgi:hypothetical protein
MPYEVHNATSTAPGFLSSHKTLKEARKAIAGFVREAKAYHRNRPHKLHASRTIGNMVRGDYIELNIGKGGFHFWNAWSIK